LETSTRKENETMKAYPNFRDLERVEGVTWTDLTALEPRLGELLWDARRGCISCRRWYEVEQVFGPIRNTLAELVGFAGKNHQHPVLGSLAAYQVAYWKLFDAMAALFASRHPGTADDQPQKPRDANVAEATCSAPATAA
jgi:hypothetical protein